MLAAALLLQAAAPPPSTARPTQVEGHSGVEREFEGIWLDEFEGTQFFEGARQAGDLTPFGTAPALAIDRNTVLNAMMPPAVARDRIADFYRPHLYRVRFIGRTDPPRDCRAEPIGMGVPSRPPPPGCIGVGGMFPALIEARRVLTLVDLGPLPPSGQPARQLR